MQTESGIQILSKGGGKDKNYNKVIIIKKNSNSLNLISHYSLYYKKMYSAKLYLFPEPVTYKLAFSVLLDVSVLMFYTFQKYMNIHIGIFIWILLQINYFFGPCNS